MIARALASICLAGAVALPVAANEIVYYTDLSGAAESPPNASAGTGWTRVTIDFDLITMRVEASFADLMGLTTVAHIHCCTASPLTGTAGVALATGGILPGFPLGVTSGSYTRVIDLTQTSNYSGSFVTGSGGTAAGAEARLISNLSSGQAYFNIHSSTYGSGEIRAFVAVVPEPATTGMLLAGLAALGVAARRRTA